MSLLAHPRSGGPGRSPAARLTLLGGLAAVALIAAACGGSSTSATTTTAAPASGSSSPPTSSAGATSMELVRSGTISGKAALVSSTGFALYTYALDKPGKIGCTGACTSSWPPLLVPKGDTLSMSVSGLGTEQRPDNGGLQVTYKGSPLYTFSGNTEAGQNNGAGIPDWSLATTAASSGNSTTTTTSSGYGGY